MRSRTFVAVALLFALALGRVARADDPPAAPAEIAALVEEAKKCAQGGELEFASAKLAEARAKGAKDADIPPALAEQVARWDAPPSLAIEEPAEGASIKAREFVVRGTFSSGRKTDRVMIGDMEVVVRAGAFEATLATDVLAAEQAVTVRVEHGGAVRGAPVVRKVKVALPWSKATREAVALAEKEDWKGAKAKVNQARAAGATDADLPESLRTGIALWEASTPVAIGKQTDPALAEIAKFANAQIASKDVDRRKEDWRTSVPKPTQAKFTASKTYTWELATNKGTIRIKLMPKVAPMHVTNVAYLSMLGFYDGVRFHRVIPGFMAQGGDPLSVGGEGRDVAVGTGGPGYRFDGEFDPAVVHDRPGLLSMANAGPGTDSSQFFLTFGAARHLDGKHTIFGEVTDGKDVLKALERAGTADGSPTETLVILKATVSCK